MLDITLCDNLRNIALIVFKNLFIIASTSNDAINIIIISCRLMLCYIYFMLMI